MYHRQKPSDFDGMHAQHQTVPYLKRLVGGLALQRLRFVPESVHVVFVVDIVALRQDFLRVLRFSHVSIIPPCLFILLYHPGDEQKAAWCLQFTDIISPHRNEHQQQLKWQQFIGKN
jgi:hypothetical protein